MLVVENLDYAYPTHRALRGVSFRLHQGSITALVGPNGAGKTTLMQTLVGLLEPLAGRVLFEDRDVHAHPQWAHRQMGYLPDFFGLYEDLTVQQHLQTAAASQGVPEAECAAQVADSAARLGLSERLGMRASDLSRGLRQRLAIARAIIHKPRFLVLDEPASGLDPDARLKLSILFRQLRDEGMTLLVSSHILAELEDYATHMLIIREGRLVGDEQVDPDHGSAREQERQVRLVLRFLGGTAQAEGWLRARSDLEVLSPERDAVVCRFTGAEVAQAALLRDLAAADLGLLACREERPRLQDHYLASAAPAAVEAAS